jgi:hypothetical protein
MYSLREDGVRKLLLIELSERLTTEEALRAMSQAFMLTEASKIRGVRCDVTRITRGPGGLLMVAAALASRYRPALHIAFVADTAQLPFISRLIRFSGVRENLRAFESAAEADTWLAPALGQPQKRLSSTARRHAETMLAARAGLVMTAARDPEGQLEHRQGAA